MSRFFARGSDSDSETSSEEEEVLVRPHKPVVAFAVSDDEDDVKRVARPIKEKRYEEVTGLIKNIRSFKKNKDMISMLSTFEDLTRVYAKAVPFIVEESGSTPKFYLRCLSEMELFVSTLWADQEGRKRMSKINSKSLACLRQKLRKYNKEFEAEINLFKESFEEDGEESESDVDLEVKSQSNKMVDFDLTVADAPVQQKSSGDESDDSIDWGSSSCESESSDSEQYVNRRHEFFRKPGKEVEVKDKKDKAKQKRDKDRKQHKAEDDQSDGEWETVKGGASIHIERETLFSKDEEITSDVLVNKLHEFLSARGKKRTDRLEQIKLFNELLNIAEANNLGVVVSIKIKLAVISSLFDYNPKILDAMKPEHWSKLLNVFDVTLDLVLSVSDIHIQENIPDDREEFEKPPYVIRGCILTVLERIDAEFFKMLKECDQHSQEYVTRLKDEIAVTKLIEKVEKYLLRFNSGPELCRFYLIKIKHMYYKYDENVVKQKRGEIPVDYATSINLMDELCKFIYVHDEVGRLRAHAILHQIYHHALHDNWFEARDLFLMSHLQESIQFSDTATQIVYNRTMAQLGLCAFRRGNVEEAHSCLVELVSSGKMKELLAQGIVIQRGYERSREREVVEKQRQMPFHMHFNLDLLECIYLVSAMLLEVPYMAAHEYDGRRRMISKVFYQQLRSSERQSLNGPPESMREHVVAAAKSLRNGDWRACTNYIINEKMNVKVWFMFHEVEKMHATLVRLIKQASLETFLLTYGHVFDSISLHSLSGMFELQLREVYAHINRLVADEMVAASVDGTNQLMIMHRSSQTSLQALAQQYADKISYFLEANERILELKTANFYRGGNYRDRQNWPGQEWSRTKRDGGTLNYHASN
ncbi:eukaryotic translation initiation factor 3 subunit C-like [Bacillus rossius redtenbacheri]|uniref:eukaryotic translation initiation factor 3 subunit C-like n=1 Tax=Bacillus rossius redtenbacheri TaxID=93214 RepID=UPI002FDD499D